MSGSPPVLLFVDDNISENGVLIRSLERRGLQATFLQTPTARQARELCEQKRPDVAVVDLELGSGPDEGLTLVQTLHKLDPTVRLLVLTGHRSNDLGVRALQSGAASFLLKPVDSDHLLVLIRDGVHCALLQRQVAQLSDSSRSMKRLSGLESRCEAMQEILNSVEFLAGCDLPVLITGETGTGKGVLAEAIHRAGYRKRFIRFQPSFVNPDLIASELFGHERGSFTGATATRKGLIEEADRGTLFIDEIGELPSHTQILLLDVLQSKRFRRVGSSREEAANFRIISASNRTLEELLQPDGLRSDLFHRISHTVLALPPLRERREDIPDLVDRHLQLLVHREKLRVLGVSDAAMEQLLNHPWPGNIRELLASVEAAAHRAHHTRKQVIEPCHLTILLPDQTPSTFRERVDRYQLQLIRKALHTHGNNQSHAAASLGLDRSTLRRILARQG